MSSSTDFQYTYRWAALLAKGLQNSADELEARDRELEEFIRNFDCSGGGGGDS